VFASVISASGARYASGQWVWWSKGSDASLYDTTLGEDAEAVLTCTEIHDTP
jgi:membrane-bound inhibitor of C-type lysozyme